MNKLNYAGLLIFFFAITASVVSCKSDTANKNYVKSKRVDKSAANQFPTEPIVELGSLKYEDVNGKRVAQSEGKPFTGVAVTKLPNGTVYTSETFMEGLKKGPYKIWHSNGKLYQEGTTLNDLNDGLYKEYYEGGQIKYEYHYKRGRKVDVWKSWYENGQQWTSRDFKNDKLDGKVLVWDTDGTLTKEYTYVNGALIDKQLYFEEE